MINYGCLQHHCDDFESLPANVKRCPPTGSYSCPVTCKNDSAEKMHQRLRGLNMCLFTCYNHLLKMLVNGCVLWWTSWTESLFHWPCGAVGQLSEGAWVSDQLVQDCDNLAKLWPVAAPLLPAVQHELVQHHGTVHRGGKTVALIYCFDHLRANKNSGELLKGGHHVFGTSTCGMMTLTVCDSHPGWTSPSRVALRMRSLPTWQCHSSTHRWLRWTSWRQWPLELSIWLGSCLPAESPKFTVTKHVCLCEQDIYSHL